MKDSLKKYFEQKLLALELDLAERVYRLHLEECFFNNNFFTDYPTRRCYFAVCYFQDAMNIYLDNLFPNNESRALKEKLRIEFNELKKKQKCSIYTRGAYTKLAVNFQLASIYSRHNKLLISDEKFIYYNNLLNFLDGRYNEIFTDFDFLARQLSNSHFANPYQFSILLDVIKTNYERLTNSRATYVPNLEELRNHKFKNITSKEIEVLLHEGVLAAFINSNNKPKKKAKAEVRGFVNEHKINLEDIKVICESICTEFMMKVEPTVDDFKLLSDNLLKLGISEDLVSTFVSKETNRIEKIKAKRIIPKVEDVPTTPTSVLSKKEVYNMKQELDTYFLLDSMIAFRPLLIKEQIYCINLMRNLFVSEHVIERFLTIMRKENKRGNPISYYVSLYPKLERYKDNEVVKKYMTSIEEVLKDMFICSDEDYEALLELIREPVSNLVDYIGNDFSYEYEEAAKLSKRP